MSPEFEALPKHQFGAILADPPWNFKTWDWKKDSALRTGQGKPPYETMELANIRSLAVADLAAKDCALFLWICWPLLLDSIETIEAWGFEYKTCAFSWIKADGTQLQLFDDQIETYMGLGYWTRANSEVCLLATRGNPKRLSADVRQAIIAPRREHSRKPDGIHGRIERLVAGPYLELFARQERPGWTCWGNEVGKFSKPYDPLEDFAESINDCYAAVRERKAAGGPGWEPK